MSIALQVSTKTCCADATAQWRPLSRSWHRNPIQVWFTSHLIQNCGCLKLETQAVPNFSCLVGQSPLPLPDDSLRICFSIQREQVASSTWDYYSHKSCSLDGSPCRYSNFDPFKRSRYFGYNLDLGQFERFRRMFHTPSYSILLNHRRHELISSLQVSSLTTCSCLSNLGLIIQPA